MLERVNKLKKLLPDKSSAFLITSDVNRFYFTGFKSSAGAVLVLQDAVVLLVDFRYYEAAQYTVCDYIDVVCYNQFFNSVNEMLDKYGIKFLLIEDEDLTVNKFLQFRNNIKAEIIDDFKLSKKILELRSIKSEDEIEKIITAQKIAEKSYLQLLNIIKVGITERELAVELEYLMKKNGAERIAFDLITISGKNTSLPHGVPSDKKLSNGDFITFDIGAVYDGYHSDMTRTVALGYATDEMNIVYDIVLKAHIEASKKISPFNTCADIDNAARNYIESKGYGKYFGHTTGHGVGLEIHENPTVYKTNDTKLKTGMIITDEPGIYLPSKFGVRIEDMYLVTDNGKKDLAFIDKELIIL